MSIREQAATELKASNFGDEDSAVMLKIIDLFFDQWDSGGAVWAASDTLARLIKGQPLCPLTGEASEWLVLDYDDRMCAQNIRCSSVFQRRDGTAYDIDAADPHATISFPYDPETQRVRAPVVVFDA